MIQRIKQTLRKNIADGIDFVDRAITKINENKRARRGIGTTGPKVNKSLYRCGGKKK